jgi:hypothetical protein
MVMFKTDPHGHACDANEVYTCRLVGFFVFEGQVDAWSEIARHGYQVR